MPSLIIATDASYLHGDKIGSWAAYIKSPAGIIQRSGIIRENKHFNGSTDAERYAIANALYIASKSFDLSEYDIILCCDNEVALYKPRNPRSNGRVNYWIEWHEIYVQPYFDNAKSYELRHVKGHLPVALWEPGNELHAMNRWCDKQARKLTRNYLKELNNGGNQSKQT